MISGFVNMCFPDSPKDVADMH